MSERPRMCYPKNQINFNSLWRNIPWASITGIALGTSLKLSGRSREGVASGRCGEGGGGVSNLEIDASHLCGRSAIRCSSRGLAEAKRAVRVKSTCL
ncbi:hypothetical protein E2C01_048616 [Portunus trituberculatus]|uniref:Uncharacterized protein n=1 Tax=Portunus trituberculatus TaxID=210409 RepID=A0A5B7G6X3_PORTR|nr:hypothetical protein [Portunus trituberculatus]